MCLCACVLVCLGACVLMCVCVDVCVCVCLRARVRAYVRAWNHLDTHAQSKAQPPQHLREAVFFYFRRPGPPVMENRSFNEKKERKRGGKEKRRHPSYPSLKGRLKNRIKSHVRLWRRRTARPVIRCGKLDAFPLFLFSFPSFFFLAGP